ncbi:unnamed protein product [Vicia faba]|uniref:Uncharacterized protein n=1 Tax=Vicia faba TaxID=3906 RepID=A0AAV1AQC8_VICFA|nr:unnamed protein product [Vicia faba]
MMNRESPQSSGTTVTSPLYEFRLSAKKCGRLQEQQFLGYFIGGLRQDIHSRVRTIKPCNRYLAMQLARDVECQFAVAAGQDSGSRYKPGHGSWAKSQKPNWAFREGEGNRSAIQTQTNNYLGKTRTGSGFWISNRVNTPYQFYSIFSPKFRRQFAPSILWCSPSTKCRG